MERCDFSSVINILKLYINANQEMAQYDLILLLFDDYDQATNSSFDFDHGQVCRWFNGQAKVSPSIARYYQKDAHLRAMAKTVRDRLFPIMYDSSMAVQKVYELLIGDSSISEQKKTELTTTFPCQNDRDAAYFIAKCIYFGMNRAFVKRNPKKNALPSGNVSPILADFIYGCEVPKPCRFFCGRDEELIQLHQLLSDQGKVFLHGIAGIGKSELAKAYADLHKIEYTNILYVNYSGDLQRDIINMDFSDDLPNDTDSARFFRHDRFLKTLKEDTLLIVDNFNATATEDDFLPAMMRYRFRVLFTTRCRLENYTSMHLDEISDTSVLLDLMGKYYSRASRHTGDLKKIIETVHSHTLAVELAARLLEHGVLKPSALLRKLRIEKAALDDANKISIIKDGKPLKETYYGHIHTLFSIYLLSADRQQVMRCMALIPLSGISSRLLASWLSLRNLNTVYDLIETGFITPLFGGRISLPPMIQEITMADLTPSVSSCRTMLSNLQAVCLAPGIDISYYKLLFYTIENVIYLAKKDDIPFYLRFVEDSYIYMDKYQYEHGLILVVQEMDQLLTDPAVGIVDDRALLLDYQARLKKNPEEEIQLRKKALSLFPEVTAENALLVSNIHSNLGNNYLDELEYDPACQHMETGIRIMEQYGLTYMNDSVAKNASYAMLLIQIGKPWLALTILQETSKVVKENNSDHCSDYAFIQEATGRVYLSMKKLPEAFECFKTAQKIYEIVWENSPDLLEAKQDEIQKAFLTISLMSGNALLLKGSKG